MIGSDSKQRRGASIVAIGVVLGTVLCVSPCLGVEIIQWVDAHGVTHYSDRPPRDPTP
jgi:hypothetical protein